MVLSNLVKTALFITVAMPVAFAAYAQGQNDHLVTTIENSRVAIEAEPTAQEKMRPLNFSEQQEGLRGVLSQCVRYAARNLGVKDSFVKNPKVRLSIPSVYISGELLLIETNDNKSAEDLLLRINRAAEGSIPKAAGYFLVAVSQMREKDVVAVSASDDDSAATIQLHRRMAKGLIEVVRPVIQGAMEQERLESIYAVKRTEVDVKDAPVPFDAESYLVEKVLEVFFVSMSKEEKALRAKRSSCDEDITCWYLAEEIPDKKDLFR